MNIILWLVLGAIAGSIASSLTKSSHSLVIDILLGIFGASVGGFLLNLLGGDGVTGFNIYSLLVSVVGAVVLITLGRALHR
jgi:uncharacterized membrane protein YeaQ/YmgE (transglycosylase-associated protein family)